MTNTLIAEHVLDTSDVLLPHGLVAQQRANQRHKRIGDDAILSADGLEQTITQNG